MELVEYVEIIKKRMGLILSVTIGAALISAIMSIFVLNPVYESKALMIVGKTPNSDQDKVQYNDVMMYQNLVKTYAEVAKSERVAKETIEKTGYDMKTSELKDKLTVTPKPGTQILEITVQSDTAEKAYKLTDTLSKVFVEQVSVYMNTNDVKIMDEAQLSSKPIKPRKTLNVVIAAILGFMASLGIAFLMEYLDNTIKTESDVEKYLGLTVLASVPYLKEEDK